MRKKKYELKIVELFEKGDILTAQEVHSKLENIDIVTVYRNLQNLVNSGILKELFLKKGESYYEVNKDNHQHAKCNNCGKIFHIKIDKPKLLQSLELENFELEDIDITIKGHCK